MPLTVRVATKDDFEPILQTLRTAFHEVDEDAEITDIDRSVFEPDRSLVTVDDGKIVGHVGAYSRDLTVPGGVIPAGYVTMVGVAGSYRRQGIASRMLKQQLFDIRDRGESAAILWASEGRIYQRFGYAMGCRRTEMEIDTREVRLNPPRAEGGMVRAGATADFRKDMETVYEQVRKDRPGYASRNQQWWDFMLQDPKRTRHGAGPLRSAVYYGQSGAPEGYALYRVRPEWDDSGPKGQVVVRHVVAAKPVAYQELWRFLLEVDLTRSAYLVFGSASEPLIDMVNEPRRLGVRTSDGLWLRLVDVPQALAARPADGGLVLEVTDSLMPHNNGRFRLDGSRADTDPDVKLDVSTLAMLYLGGANAGDLAIAGRISETRPGGIAKAHAAFASPVTPVGIDMF